MWSGVGWDYKAELYFLTNLILPALPEILGCDHSKETSLTVHMVLLLKKKLQKKV